MVAGRPEMVRPDEPGRDRDQDPFEFKNERFGLDDEVIERGVLSGGGARAAGLPASPVRQPPTPEEVLRELRNWRDQQLAGVTNPHNRQLIMKEYLDLVNHVQQGSIDRVLDEIGVTGINTFETSEPGNQSSTASLLSIPTEGQFKITDDLLLPQEELQTTIDLIVNEAAAYGLDSNQLAYVLATVHWESKLGGDMSERYEGDDPNVYFRNLYWDDVTRRNQLGNLFESDAWTYSGRGFVQLTGRGNYTFYSTLFGEDILNNPNRLIEDKKLAVRILVHGMSEGIFTWLIINEQNGQLDITLVDEEDRNKLSKYNFPEDFIAAREIIGSGSAEEIAEIAQAYACALAELCQIGALPEGIVCADAKCP